MSCFLPINHGMLPINASTHQWDKNAMTDIPSRLFGSVPKWHFKTEQELQTFFNNTFPLPHKQLWTVYRPSIELGMHVISILRTQHSTLANWW
jgi:hypothetical protein